MARLFWNTVNITDFGTGCWRELILVKSWIFIKMTSFTPSTGFALKIAKKFPKFCKKFPKFDKKLNIPVTYWSYSLDVFILHGPFAATGLHVQHAPLPDVPMMYHKSMGRQKTITPIKKAQSLRKRMGHFPWRLASSWIWCGNQLLLPCFPPTPPQKTCRFPQEIKYSQSILIPQHFQATFLKKWHLGVGTMRPFICPTVSSVPLPFLSPQHLQKLPDRQGRGNELWVLGGKTRYKNP